MSHHDNLNNHWCHYVYEYRHPTFDFSIYVGKGSGDRHQQALAAALDLRPTKGLTAHYIRERIIHGANPEHYRAKILRCFRYAESALRHEINTIRQHDPYLNITTGGEPGAGFQQTGYIKLDDGHECTCNRATNWQLPAFRRKRYDPQRQDYDGPFWTTAIWDPASTAIPTRILQHHKRGQHGFRPFAVILTETIDNVARAFKYDYYTYKPTKRRKSYEPFARQHQPTADLTSYWNHYWHHQLYDADEHIRAYYYYRAKNANAHVTTYYQHKARASRQNRKTKSARPSPHTLNLIKERLNTNTSKTQT